MQSGGVGGKSARKIPDHPPSVRTGSQKSGGGESNRRIYGP